MAQTEMRDHQVNVRFNEEEWRRTQDIADRYGVNVPNVIRLLLKREAESVRVSFESEEEAVLIALKKRGSPMTEEQLDTFVVIQNKLDPTRLEEALAKLVRAGVLVRRKESGHSIYGFKPSR
jgi:antitoxin component of RelBE/YafQ-DinJ toxin-antitoxin module